MDCQLETEVTEKKPMGINNRTSVRTRVDISVDDLVEFLAFLEN